MSNLPLQRIGVVFLVVLVLGLMQGCFGIGPKLGPDYSPPKLEMQDAWHQAVTAGFADGEANLQTWWTVFEDPVLNGLIERAGRGNLGLKEAVARIKEARAQRGIAAGERFPDIDSTGAGMRKRSPHTFLSPTTQRSRTDDFFKFGGEGSWEIDFWGRIDRSIESADASLAASVEDYRDVLVVLYAEVSTNYVEVRALQDRIKYVRSNIETQRKTLQLTKDRFDAEVVSELDVQQAELNLARTESSLSPLQMLLIQTINRLGVLLGEHPGALHDELVQQGSIPKPPEQTAVGLPVELLRQRPDIRQAERELAAQTALIGVAKADLYPSFSLFGTFEVAANDFSDAVSYSKSRMHSFGPSFRWNIFDGGRVRNQIRVEDARTEQALARYEQTVLNALEDVENAMVSYVREKERMGILERSVNAAQKSVELVRVLYVNDLTDFQNLLDMERTLFVQQDQFADSEGMVSKNLIRIYKALGGGWDSVTTQASATK
jgi:NodT family efflux transporter outer membrane factor (OMF) lipoprotein